MKKKIFIVFTIFLLFTISCIAKNTPLKVFVDDKEVKNNGDYFVKDGKAYVSQDALQKDFGFNVFYEEKENKIRLYDFPMIQYKARVSLFEDFAKIYDPKNEDEVVTIWAQGIKERNGAFQYLVLNNKLKEDFKKEAEENNRLGWVTGFSSPWVEDYKISKEKIDDNIFKYKVNFKAIDSSQTVYPMYAELTVSKEDNKWRITNIVKNF